MSTPKPVIFDKLEKSSIGISADAASRGDSKAKLEQALQKEKQLDNGNNKALSELLTHLFKANPKGVNEFFANQSNNKEMIVAISQKHSEGYESDPSKVSGFKCVRTWHNISPIQAAAVTGDNFLVKQLLTLLPTHLCGKAAKQLESIVKSHFYMAAFHELKKSYKDFMTEYYNPLPHHFNTHASSSLWEQVGEKLKKLYAYGLQEICKEDYFSEYLLQFEPKRECLMTDGRPLNLNYLGKGQRLPALTKLKHRLGGSLLRYDTREGGWYAIHQGYMQDLIWFIDVLCNTRKKELEDIIKSLNEKAAEYELKSKQDQLPEAPGGPRL